VDFALSPEQEALRDSVRGFARRTLADRALERAHDPSYPWDLAAALGKQSLLGLALPEAHGGGGAALLDAVLVMEELAAVCPTSADVFQAGNFGAIRTLSEYAGEKLRDRILPPLLDGTGLIALGMSEPEAGSAVTDLRTTARVEGDWCVVNGTKMWSTNSTDATVFLVYARFGPGARGIGSVIVERDAPGLTVGPPEAYMSGEQWSLLTFDDCRVPVENVLIDSDGFKRQISAFNVERIGNATRALSLGRLCYSTARDHAATRKQFGKTLSEFQGVQWKFAEMTVQLDAAQLLLYRAASDLHDGLPRARETAIAKYACNTAGFNAANESLQVMGAMGYSTQTLVEYCLRRTRGWMIAGGSLEMLRNRIAESVFGTRFSQRAS